MEEPLILDRYRPLAHLGSGGHGSVVLAFDTRMARRVAVKRLPLPRARTGGVSRKAGLAEARTAAMLNHPNIVTVHEWDTDSDEAFIVMEDVNGASVAELLDEVDGPLTLDEAAAVLTQVASALEFAHRNGVLHLDLKPANVLVTREGRVKVADFGVSALTDASGLAHGTAGTIGYMPPEQIRGEALNERTDCWALASLAYELLTGANPFDADTAESSLFKIEVAEVPAPSEFEPELPAAVDDVLMAALASDPAERYPGVAAFTSALAPHLGDPALGTQALADLVSEYAGEPEHEDFVRPGAWDRLAPYVGWARRIGSALACGWLAWAGVGAFAVGTSAVLGAAALVALAGALAPGLGFALGYAAFAIGIFAKLGWVACLLALLTLGAFWALVARRGTGEGLAPVAGPLAGILRAGPAVPLLYGFVFRPLPAAGASAIAAIATMFASALTGGRGPLLQVGMKLLTDPFGAPARAGVRALADPTLLIPVAAWALAGALCSLGCHRASRAGAAAGVIAGLACLLAGYAGWAALQATPVLPETLAIDFVVSAMVMVVVTALGAPTRAEEE